VSEEFLPILPCVCGSIRRTSRALTQVYEQALRRLGLRATQFTILQVLSRAGDASQRRLGQMLAMDSSTLTRTLEIMSREGWVEHRRGKDQRQRWWSLTKSGRMQLQRAEPVWAELQSRLRRRVGAGVWDNLFQLTNEVANIIENQGDQL
jgi:DNA-binding MarR family transcriptional regulator